MHKHCAAAGDKEYITSLKGLFSAMGTGKIPPLKSLIVQHIRNVFDFGHF